MQRWMPWLIQRTFLRADASASTIVCINVTTHDQNQEISKIFFNAQIL